VRLRRPDAATLDRLLDEARAADFTYREVGATNGRPLPEGFRVDRYERSLGSDEGAFERAAEALREWRAHTGAGVAVEPAGTRLEPGGTVLLLLRTLGVWAVAPVRVVYVVDEPDRFAFAYGTLPTHPERGEAAISLPREQGEVVCRLVSFSRTVDPLARLGAPIARRVQRRVTERYLDALAAAAR
jgi:uncharacterized protein (UPF0548 family)